MSQYLPRLRTTLDVMPSPFPDQPGIVLRDPFSYCEDLLLIPESMLTILACLDGMCPEVRGKRTAPSTPSSEYHIRR